MRLFGLGAIEPGLGRTYWPAVGVRLAGCTPNWDFSTQDPRWVELFGNADNALHIAFPKPYYEWCQEYLRAKTGRPPSPNAPAAERVVWALDVWSHVQYALLALNIPLGAPPRGMGFDYSGAIRFDNTSARNYATRGSEMLERFWYETLDFYKYKEMDREAGIAANKKKFMNDAIRERIAAAPLRPGPFTTIVPFWTGAALRFGQASWAYSNPIKFRWAQQCMPWMDGGLRLESKDGKDAQLWQANPGMRAALMQWRMWCLREWFPWSADEKRRKDWNVPGMHLEAFPRFMGSAKNTVNLDVYVQRVSTESTSAPIEGTEQGWYPTLNSVISSLLPRYAGIITGTPYDNAVRNHVSRWMELAKPPLDQNGEILRNPQGDQYTMPLTCVDFNDAYDDHVEAIESRMHSDIERIGGKDQADMCLRIEDDKQREQCRTVAEQNARFTQLANKIPPMALVMKIMKFVLHGLVEWLGAAVSATLPIRIIPQPFLRSPADERYKVAVDGSTALALASVTNAMLWVQYQLDIWLMPGSDDPTPIITETQKCEEVMKDSKGVERCVSNVPGDCAEVVFDQRGSAVCLSQYTPAQFRERYNIAPPDCGNIVEGYERQVGTQLPYQTKLTAIALCQAELAGERPQGSAYQFVEKNKYVANVPAPTVGGSDNRKWWIIGALAVGAYALSRRED